MSAAFAKGSTMRGIRREIERLEARCRAKLSLQMPSPSVRFVSSNDQAAAVVATSPFSSPRADEQAASSTSPSSPRADEQAASSTSPSSPRADEQAASSSSPSSPRADEQAASSSSPSSPRADEQAASSSSPSSPRADEQASRPSFPSPYTSSAAYEQRCHTPPSTATNVESSSSSLLPPLECPLPLSPPLPVPSRSSCSIHSPTHFLPSQASAETNGGAAQEPSGHTLLSSLSSPIRTKPPVPTPFSSSDATSSSTTERLLPEGGDIAQQADRREDEGEEEEEEEEEEERQPEEEEKEQPQHQEEREEGKKRRPPPIPPKTWKPSARSKICSKSIDPQTFHNLRTQWLDRVKQTEEDQRRSALTAPQAPARGLVQQNQLPSRLVASRQQHQQQGRAMHMMLAGQTSRVGVQEWIRSKPPHHTETTHVQSVNHRFHKRALMMQQRRLRDEHKVIAQLHPQYAQKRYRLSKMIRPSEESDVRGLVHSFPTEMLMQPSSHSSCTKRELAQSRE